MTLHTTLAALLLSLAGLVTAGGAHAQAPLKGRVLEVRDVDAYTYLRLETAQGETWAAVTRAAVKTGAQVSITNPMVMNNFESKALKKTFDKIVFGTLEGGGAPAVTGGPATGGASAAARPHGMGSFNPGAATSAHVPAVAAPVKVSKAAGPDARSVAEVVSGKATLKDKPVTLRGQVVKVNTGIMGKNWLHLQDGSGTAGAGTNDVLVTTKDVAAVGDVVEVKGTIRTDVQLGAGYDYAVLIDNATLRK
jgi:hypothetical protein